MEEPGSDIVAVQSAAPTVVLWCRSLSAEPSPAHHYLWFIAFMVYGLGLPFNLVTHFQGSRILTPENGTDRMSLNVCNKITAINFIIVQKNAFLKINSVVC